MKSIDAEKINVNIPTKVMKALRWLSKRQNRPYSEIIREAVKSHVVTEVNRINGNSPAK